jgi:hypothetical protein
MRAVWSFWSKPYGAATGWGWSEPLHHLLAWGLSLRLARRHYPDTVLVTDRAGRSLLVDGLGLSFTQVSTELERLHDADASLWALGKLVAYSLQDEPFVHLDTDVFLWRPLPARLSTAPVLAQHPERWPVEGPSSAPRVIEDAFARDGLGLPAEWEWARSHWDPVMHQANCGIVGGMNAEFLRYYAGLALDIVLNSRYAATWRNLAGRPELNMIIEQFMLSACLEFHRSDPGSEYRGIQARYLFPSSQAAFDARYAARLGFTHLIADAKSDARVARQLEERVRREDRDFYRRCVELAGKV